MKERGIIMSGQNPALILEGRKTQTRRLCKIDPLDGYDSPNCAENLALCPYGVPGDRLWVREAYYVAKWWHRQKGVRLQGHYLCDTAPFAVTLSEAEASRWYDRVRNEGGFPSIFMYRSLSRIIRGIGDVRIERLQDITEKDALAEGIDDLYLVQAKMPSDARVYCYRLLFESLHGEGSWAANPFVWVLDLQKI